MGIQVRQILRRKEQDYGYYQQIKRSGILEGRDRMDKNKLEKYVRLLKESFSESVGIIINNEEEFKAVLKQVEDNSEVTWGWGEKPTEFRYFGVIRDHCELVSMLYPYVLKVLVALSGPMLAYNEAKECNCDLLELEEFIEVCRMLAPKEG
jgi:hypothetical protein